MAKSRQAALRAAFLGGVLHGLQVIWPIVSALLLAKAALGALVGLVEGWGFGAGIYFAFVTGLTIGYGDLAPSMVFTRVVAVAIGLLGVLLTGLLAALAVTALHAALSQDGHSRRM